MILLVAILLQMYNKIKISQQNPLYFQHLRHKNGKNVQKCGLEYAEMRKKLKNTKTQGRFAHKAGLLCFYMLYHDFAEAQRLSLTHLAHFR